MVFLATPLYNLHDPWGVFYFWFITGKSSWVHSRTQGSIPMLFCRWADVLWLLHSLLVPSNGWWLDQGRWSLYLLFCFCGNDQTMALYQTKCVCYFKTMKLPLLVNLVCNNFKWLRYMWWMLWTECNCEWWSLNLLWSWLYVRVVMWNPSRFHGLPGLYGLKLDGSTGKMVTIRLNLL
jgi:hypothetical protein